MSLVPMAKTYSRISIINFVDKLTNWQEAYAVVDKKAQTINWLILRKIFPRYGSSLELVTDNGTESVNEIYDEP